MIFILWNLQYIQVVIYNYSYTLLVASLFISINNRCAELQRCGRLPEQLEEKRRYDLQRRDEKEREEQEGRRWRAELKHEKRVKQREYEQREREYEQRQQYLQRK